MARSSRRRPLKRLLSAPALTLAVLLTWLLTCVTVQAQSDPTAAQNLRAELLAGEGIVLSWDAPADDAESITGYEVLRRRPRRGEDTLLSYVGDTGSDATSYTDLDAREPGERYVYRVVALRGSSRSGRSNFARVVVPELIADDPDRVNQDPADPDPADLAPSNLSVRITAYGAELSWDAPATDAATLTGYRVLRSVAESAMTILAEDTGSDDTTYTDASATTPGETYAYQVLALRGAETSQGSSTVSALHAPDVPRSAASTRTVDRAPSNLSATLRDDHIRLRWNTPQEDGSSVTGYQVLRSHAGTSWSVLTANTLSAATTYEDRATTQPGAYVYEVKAWRSGELSDGSNQTFAVQPGSCVGDQFNSTPIEVPVSATPIVVESTPSDYFVLFVRPNLDRAVEIPISVTLGAEGTTTLAERLTALPIAHYRVEKYPVDDPADMDGDCISDIVELEDLGTLNPLNRAPEIEFRHGNAAIPDRETFERLSYQGVIVQNDFHLQDLEFVKFYLLYMSTSRPAVYFMNTVTHRTHQRFRSAIETDLSHSMKGEIVYHPNVFAPDGSLGVYRFEFEPDDAYPFTAVQYAYEVLAAAMPLLENNLAYYPMPRYALPRYHSEQEQYDDSRVTVLLESDIFPDVDFISLNQGTGYGILRLMVRDDRPNPRDVVIYESLPNDLPRVAGIITTVPQTPLSHVNLRALQDRVPNAFIRDAVDEETIDSLIDSHVQYTVTRDGYTIRAATKAEVDAHYDESRPTATQTPVRDLTVTAITALSGIAFGDWDAFGVKAANVAVLGTLGFAAGTVPDGFAVPFYFYDEFMKANELDAMVTTMLADTDFQTSYDTQETELKKLRDAIEDDATTPAWIITALEEMHAQFADGRSLRYRSSTNNEDLPGFSGAGLYDSKTQDPDETADDGIDKSIKGVWASLWNFGALVERDFNRIDHSATAMGVLVHPNYSDELANGVAVSHDPFSGRAGAYYVNTQVGEDLVTNPDERSTPEELLLLPGGSYEVIVHSNRVESGQLIMSDAQLTQLRSHLSTIHDRFKALYGPAAGERFAMEIEFKITSDNVLAIKQARPWVFRPINEPPTFPDTESGVRSIPELTRKDTAIGAPVAATDTEGDALTYTLSGTDAAWFSLDNSGQLLTDKLLDFEAQDRHEVDVTVGDPFNAAATTIMVTINITDVNEDPEFPVSETGMRSLPENTGLPLGQPIGAPFSAVDPETDDVLTYSLRGTDARFFDIVPETGTLLSNAVLDYEARATYSVTVHVQDGRDREGRPNTGIDDSIDVSVMLTNEEEAGTLTLSSQQPQVGTPLTATLTDPDGGITNESWSWQRSLNGSSWTSIANAGGGRYIPVDADLNHYLRVTVHYTDGHGSGKRLQKVSNQQTATSSINNRPPSFDSSAMERSVPENSTADTRVGTAVAADDPDRDLLSYRLSGDNSFTIERANGQIRVAGGAALDHEQRRTHSVVVTASDPSGASASIVVTVTVADVNEAPAFPNGSVKLEVAEDAEAGDTVGAPVTATDVDGDRLTYGFVGNGRPFEIDESSGQIVVAAGGSFDPAIQDSYTVTVEARDLDFGAEIQVTIEVVDQPSPPRNSSGGGGGGGGGPPPVPIASDEEFDWNVTRDVESLHGDNDLPTGLWSNGEVLWVVENSATGADFVFAYDLNTGERLEQHEFELDQRNRFSHGIWSNRDLVWIADSGQDKLFAYGLESGERAEERDLALGERNRDPRGIWSDGELMLVLDSVKDALFVYDLELGRLLAEHALDKLNKSPRGIWSDGFTIWISDDGAKRIFAYRIEGETLNRYEDREFTFRSLLKAGNGDARGIWSDGDVIFVADERDDHVYTYNLPDAIDARLVSLTLSGVDFGEFSAAQTEYAAVVEAGVPQTTVEVEAAQDKATVAILPADADNDPENGHQAALIDGQDITISLTSEDGTRMLVYRVGISHCLSGLSETRLNSVQFVGGSVGALLDCAQSLGVDALYHYRDGVWVGFFLEAPEFLSHAFRDRFAEGVAAGEVLIAKRESIQITAPAAPGSN